jgi:hypothetical protein
MTRFRMTAVDGPHQGKTPLVDTRQINFNDVLQTFAQKDWGWSIEYRDINDPMDVIEIGRIDMVNRIVRALLHRRMVTVLGYVFGPATDEASFESLMGEVEDAIADSGMNVFIESDDNDRQGLVIAAHSPEHPIR